MKRNVLPLSAIVLLCCLLLSAASLRAEVTLARVFQSGMVLQRGKPVPVWGTAEPGQTVVVTFNKTSSYAQADTQGRWELSLPPMKAGGPYTLRVYVQTDENLRKGRAGKIARGAVPVVELSDILVGDVWLCSGQSNVDVTIERVFPQYAADIDSYSNSRIRLLRLPPDLTLQGPRADIAETVWRPLDKENAWSFSALGYFLGQKMMEGTGVPQGVIVNSVGGSSIQAWLSADVLEKYLPYDYRRLLYYRDDALLGALMKTDGQAERRWQQLMDDTDVGLAEDFHSFACDDSQWRLVSPFDSFAGESFIGSYWLRCHFTLDAAHAGLPARLLLGTLYDADVTFVNGQRVGNTTYQYPPRRYDLPEGLLREGDNVIAVRLVTHSGTPHFIPEKPYKLVFADGSETLLPLSWLVHEGVAMPPCPVSGVTLRTLPSGYYNAMAHPLAPYALAGVLWYQGETNTVDDADYRQALVCLIDSWRQRWGDETLPFVIVQLANYEDPAARTPYDWPRIREAQQQVADSVPHTALTVTIDLGEGNDIHPLRKREVAERAAQAFRRLLWDKKTTLSPRVLRSEVTAEGIVLELDAPLASAGPFHEWEVAASDGIFMPAEARGEGRHIILTSPVTRPAKVRYAWCNNPSKADVYAVNGFPLPPLELAIE
ncbi:MAG: sialate O-acetylesterase [Bacteroidaceae bacterium]|nr:sialate O-acetylesterase [Bacteroidaceae bacterium]